MTNGGTPNTPFEYESEQPPSLSVVEALATLKGVDPTELDYTLFDYIDPQTLDTLTRSGTVEITFTVEQYTVHITESDTSGSPPDRHLVDQHPRSETGTTFSFSNKKVIGRILDAQYR